MLALYLLHPQSAREMVLWQDLSCGGEADMPHSSSESCDFLYICILKVHGQLPMGNAHSLEQALNECLSSRNVALRLFISYCSSD